MLPRESNMVNRPGLQLILLGALFLLLIISEYFLPRRPFALPRLPRAAVNLGLSALSNILLYLLLPLAALKTAYLAQAGGWGLLNLVPLSPAVSFAAAFLLLDLVIYFQHRMFHRLPLLWRLHRVHHVDEELDVTSGVRFHPAEILLSMGIKLAAIALLGAGPAAVAAFELVLAATSLFNHSNISIPPRTDAFLRLFLVTPDFHRVHHSIERDETDSNFGFNLPWWDMLLGTYRAQPRAGHLAMPLGLKEFRGQEWVSIPRLLTLPFIHPGEKR